MVLMIVFSSAALAKVKTTYYDNGQKQVEANYENGKKHGLLTRWNENGHKEYEVNLKNGKLNGLKTAWHENGQKESEINYENSKQHGLATKWHENTKKKEEKNYKNGKWHGLWTGWDENGKKKFERNYKNGKLNGLTTSWHDNGQKELEGNFENNKRYGLHIKWHKNGQKEFDGNFENGKRHGLHTEWYENGRRDVEICFQNGEVVFMSSCSKNTQTANNQKQGVSAVKTIHYDNRQKKGVSNYENGKQHELTYNEIDSNVTKMTEAQFDVYSNNLKGTQVTWTGEVVDVDSNWLSDDYEVKIDMDNTGIPDVRFDVDKHTALELYKGKSYQFTGSISHIFTIFGGANIQLDYATIK